MASVSKSQYRLILLKRNQYKSKKLTPKKWKWIWGDEWDDVNYKKLPERVNEGSIVREIVKEEVRKILKESTEDFYELLIKTEPEVLLSIKNKEKIKFHPIPKNPYIKALEEFVKYGELIRFPKKYIYQWKGTILENIALLKALTSINGHTSSFPYDDFLDTFNYDPETQTYDNLDAGEFSIWLSEYLGRELKKDDLYDFSNCYEFLEDVYDIDSVIPQFTNGQFVLSDYALEPLLKLADELSDEDDAEDILVTINKVLDVTHQRSDIAELFIEGGSSSLSEISN